MLKPIAAIEIAARTALLVAAFSLPAILIAAPIANPVDLPQNGTPSVTGQSPQVDPAPPQPATPTPRTVSPRRRPSRSTSRPRPPATQTDRTAATQAAQRQKDQRLLQLQQTDSNLQQQLQDNQLRQLNKARQAQQDEPRIQSAPTLGQTGAVPGTPAQPVPQTNQGPARIQDNPAPPPANQPPTPQPQ